MNSIIKEINLNVGQPNNYQLIHAMQGDNDTITIVAHLFNINKPYVIQESVDTILFSATTPTKSYIAKNIEKYDDNSVIFELDKNILAINGEVVFSIIFMDSNTKQSLSTFPSIIHITNAPDGEIQETDISVITDYVFEAKEYAELAKEYYDKLVSEKGQANGIAVLDENTKVPISELYEATTESKGIVQLADDVTSDSTTTAATINSVKTVNDALTAEKERATNAEKELQSTINSNKPNWDDKYTKNEVDNKFSTLETNIDWKEAVDIYDDIATTYPNPVDGWTVNVKDTDFTYRYNGTEWVPISANAIPKATQSVDGLMTKEDKTKLDGVATGAEVNQNAFGNVFVSSTTISADSKTDTFTIESGENVTITPDAETNKITISSKDTVYTHPDTPGNKHIPSGGSSGQILKWAADGTANWGDAGDAETMVTGVKGSEESEYRKGLVNITKENIGLGNVDNTADKDKSVKYATSAGSATKATQDGNGNVISDTYALQSVVIKKAGKVSAKFSDLPVHLTVPSDPCIVGVITGVTGNSPKCGLYYYTSKTGTLIEVVNNSGYKPLVSGTTISMGGTTGVLFAIG